MAEKKTKYVSFLKDYLSSSDIIIIIRSILKGSVEMEQEKAMNEQMKEVLFLLCQINSRSHVSFIS